MCEDSRIKILTNTVLCWCGICYDPVTSQSPVKTVEWIELGFGIEAILGLSNSTLCWKGIWISLEIKVLTSGTLF